MELTVSSAIAQLSPHIHLDIFVFGFYEPWRSEHLQLIKKLERTDRVKAVQ